MSLRQHILSASAMQDLRNTLRHSLTPQQLALYLTDTITDPAVQAAMQKAIGKKADKPVPVRTADAITAHLLGFANTHEMFAHYNNVRMAREWRFTHTSRHDDSFYEFMVEDGIEVSVLDAMVLGDADFEHDRIEERFQEVGLSDLIPLSETQREALISKDSDAPAVLLSMQRDGLFDDFMPTADGLAVAFDRLEDMLDFMGSGLPFALDGNQYLRHYGDTDMDVFSVAQSEATSEQALLQHLLGEGMLGDLLPTPLPCDASFLLSNYHDGNAVYNLGNGYTLWHNRESLMFILAHNDRPVIGGGICLHSNDLRRQAFDAALTE